MNGNFTDRTVQSAARWYARLQAFDCTPAEREEFARWCDADPAHAAAYAAARDLAAAITRCARSHSRLRAMADAAIAGSPETSAAPSRIGRWLGVGALFAASAVVAFGAARMLETAPSPETRETIAHVATQRATRVLELGDGSVVHVDVNSELEIRFSAHERAVALRRGRAVFDVAHDASRPFVVAAGSERVTAVGTRFQVSRSSLETVVTLAEGIVTVRGESDGTQRTERLVPGDELRIAAHDGARVMSTVDPRAATSWSTGRLVFREARLVDALREVNRYADTKVRLGDASLADLAVSGNFVAGDSKAVIAAFAAVLPLRVADDGGELLVYRLQ